MGVGYTWECKKCGYIFGADIGVGFLYPIIYNETMEKAKRGELGSELKEILEVYPEAAIDPEDYIFRCEDCGEYECEPILTAYIPKEGVKLPAPDKDRIWSVSFPFKGYAYVSSVDMMENYDIFEEYNHQCKKCGGKMKALTEKECLEGDGMICPHCKMRMEMINFWYWD